MKIFLINLERRSDRLEYMKAQLADLNLDFTRICAIDGIADGDIGYPEDHNRLSKPEYACYLSHVKCWEAFLDTDDEYCLILEDDVQLAKSLPQVLNMKELFQHDRGVTKLEAYDEPVWVDKTSVKTVDRFTLHRVTTFIGGTAAYVLSRDYAAFLLAEHHAPTLPADDTVYAQHYTKIGRSNIMQVLPAPAIQLTFLAAGKNTEMGESDLQDARVDNGRALSRRLTTRKRLLREILRPFRQIGERVNCKKMLLDFDD